MLHQVVVTCSGPAGMATAIALLEKVVQKTLPDTCVGLEPEIESSTRRLSDIAQNQWSVT